MTSDSVDWFFSQLYTSSCPVISEFYVKNLKRNTYHVGELCGPLVSCLSVCFVKDLLTDNIWHGCSFLPSRSTFWIKLIFSKPFSDQRHYCWILEVNTSFDLETVVWSACGGSHWEMWSDHLQEHEWPSSTPCLSPPHLRVSPSLQRRYSAYHKFRLMIKIHMWMITGTKYMYCKCTVLHLAVHSV